MAKVMDGESESVVSDDATTDDELDYFNFLDDILHPEPQPKCPNLQPLVPEGTTDDLFGAIQFAENFSERYGIHFPIFFPGSLSEAMEEALMRTVYGDPTLVIIYLHHVKSICSNVFCSQVLCSELVASYLEKNFIIWGWDMTAESNRQSLFKIMIRLFGEAWHRNLSVFEVDHFPVLLLATPDLDAILLGILGTCSEEETMTRLMDAADKILN